MREIVNHLERLCSIEGMKRILALATPGQLAMVALVWDGLAVDEAAQALGLSTHTGRARLSRLGSNVLAKFPEYQTMAQGRKRVYRLGQKGKWSRAHD